VVKHGGYQREGGRKEKIKGITLDACMKIEY
jgi:hypothetical protein